MRRMISAWIAVIAIMGLAGTAFAAKWTGSIDAGGTLPSGDFGSSDKANAGAGWSIGGSADYFWRDDVAIGLDGAYGQNKNAAEGTVMDLGGGDTQTIDKASYSTWSFGGHAKYFFPLASTMPVRWFGLLGGDIYGFNPDVETTTVTGGVSSSSTYKATDKRAGMKLGLGGEWWANPQVGVTGGVDYNMAFLSKSESPYSSFSYLGGHVGVVFNIPSSTDTNP